MAEERKSAHSTAGSHRMSVECSRCVGKRAISIHTYLYHGRGIRSTRAAILKDEKEGTRSADRRGGGNIRPDEWRASASPRAVPTPSRSASLKANTSIRPPSACRRRRGPPAAEISAGSPSQQSGPALARYLIPPSLSPYPPGSRHAASPLRHAIGPLSSLPDQQRQVNVSRAVVIAG